MSTHGARRTPLQRPMISGSGFHGDTGRFKLAEMFQVMLGQIAGIRLKREGSAGRRGPGPLPASLVQGFKEVHGFVSDAAEDREISVEIAGYRCSGKPGPADERGGEYGTVLVEYPLESRENDIPLAQEEVVKDLGHGPLTLSGEVRRGESPRQFHHSVRSGAEDAQDLRAGHGRLRRE